MTEAERERAAVVRFLRAASALSQQPVARQALSWAADAIERGDHIREERR